MIVLFEGGKAELLLSAIVRDTEGSKGASKNERMSGRTSHEQIH